MFGISNASASVYVDAEASSLERDKAVVFGREGLLDGPGWAHDGTAT